MYTVPVTEVEIRGNTNTPDEQQTLTLECIVIANPLATIQWSKENQSLHNSSRISITYQFNSVEEPTSTSTLTVREITSEDDGDYICTANNSLSQEHISANFTVFVTGDLTK